LLVVPGLLLRRWEGEPLCVVFVPRSNTTHLLTHEAGEVLQAALDGRPLPPQADADTVRGLLVAGLLQPASAS